MTGPKDAKWLADTEKQKLEDELQKEQQGIKPVKNYAAAFKSKVVILLSLQYALWSIGVYGFVMWLPSIIKAAPNMDIVKNGLAFFTALCFCYYWNVDGFLFF
jgi:hypothetical protein